MAYTQADVDLANGHIAQAERHIVQQLELIGRLRKRDLPTAVAEELLATFRSTLEQHRTHRDYMLEQLGR